MVCNIIYSITSKYLPPDQSKQTFAVPVEKHNNKRPKMLKTACWPKFQPHFILTSNISIRTGISAFAQTRCTGLLSTCVSRWLGSGRVL